MYKRQVLPEGPVHTAGLAEPAAAYTAPLNLQHHPVLGYFDTVSYTHLDVYKRQVNGGVPRGGDNGGNLERRLMEGHKQGREQAADIDGDTQDGYGPVSYTHLDVYKRQVLDR